MTRSRSTRWTWTWPLVAAALAVPSPAKDPPGREVTIERIRAHTEFLTSEALKGRGSATEGEAIAAEYVAAQFAAAGLTPAPGRKSYVEEIKLTRHRQTGPATLTSGLERIDGLTLISGVGGIIIGAPTAIADKTLAIPRARVLLITDCRTGGPPIMDRAHAAGAELVIVAETDQTRALAKGDQPVLPVYRTGTALPRRITIASLPCETIKRLASTPADLTLTVPFRVEAAMTRNVIGYRPGRDPSAPVVLLSAHIDHLGQRADGTIMPGANDDASGVAAIIELANILGARKPPRRGLLFVGYGSEEIGTLGAQAFAERPPIPLTKIVAHLGFELIGQLDKSLPPGSLMMTGYDRSSLGKLMRSWGAPIAADPHPEMHLFERSDNYALAVHGVVAHTLAGWTGPTYHQPTDTVDTLDLVNMTQVIKAMAHPIFSLAESSESPAWEVGGKPPSDPHD